MYILEVRLGFRGKEREKRTEAAYVRFFRPLLGVNVLHRQVIKIPTNFI
jgi:hypothetical protein